MQSSYIISEFFPMSCPSPLFFSVCLYAFVCFSCFPFCLFVCVSFFLYIAVLWTIWPCFFCQGYRQERVLDGAKKLICITDINKMNSLFEMSDIHFIQRGSSMNLLVSFQFHNISKAVKLLHVITFLDVMSKNKPIFTNFFIFLTFFC